VVQATNKYTVCSPVWQVEQLPDGSFNEDAAFNAELFAGHSHKPLVMSAGDTIRVHFFVGSKSQGWFIRVTDLNTHRSGTIVLNSQYGPLLPAFDTREIGNALGWGAVFDTPNSFVWEIGHTSNLTFPTTHHRRSESHSGALITTEPLPCNVRISPRSRSSARACLTVGRATPNRSTISASLGSREPGG
jgi:hypothetical protein